MERLLDYFTPENYKLTLNINKETERVRGKVEITGEPKADIIKLHAKNLKISSVEADGENVDFEHKSDILSFQKSKNIKIDFSFNLNHNMEGAYLSTYKHDGKEQKIVTTQFESHYARECFPCIDEPAAKATFDLKIIDHDPEDTVLSNMPVKREKIRDVPTFDLETATLDTKNTNKQKIVEFKTTPRMSTYLLAFCLGHFNKKTVKNKHGVKITTYAALNQAKELLDFPTKIAAEALDYYDDLFDMPYPLPKLDQVALPDFEAGAMENWGLVTYREACLLAGKTTPKPQKEYIATVITHELSHQWFGDLVTMEWWDDLWLNESFASVMQYLSVDDLYPDWNIMEDFFTGDCYAALKRDALPGVQAVKQPVKNPEEIATLFDGAIVYAKGAHLIFMLMRLMGRDNFFAGIRDYFKKHQYKNTIGDDLWAALDPYADFDVKEFMDAWISKPGYPVVTDGVQQRFLLTGATDDTKWPLPEITDDLSGHYLLNLSKEEFDQKIADFENLNLEQRLRLLIDREMLSKTSLVSSASLMDLLPKFKDETSEAVWRILATILSSLKLFARPDTEYYEPYKKYVYGIIEPQLKRLGFASKKHEDPSDRKLRQLILGFALYAEDETTIKKLARHFDNNYQKIDPELRDDILSAKFKATKEGLFDQLLKGYTAEPDPSLRSDLLEALTDAEKPENTKKLIDLLEQPEIVRPQDHIYLFANLLSNHKTRSRTFAWLYENWDYVKKITGDKSLDDYLRVAAARVYTIEDADDFYAFFDPKADDPALSRSIAVAHTDISARLRWLREDSAAVHSRLS